MGPQPLPAGEMLQPRRRPVVGVHHTWTAGGGAFTETGLMFRCFVMRLVSLAVVRKRAGRGESGPVAAKAPRRMRGPGRALSSNVRASCGRPVPRSSVAIVMLVENTNGLGSRVSKVNNVIVIRLTLNQSKKGPDKKLVRRN